MGTEEDFDDEVDDDLPRRRFLAGAIGIAVAAILIAATVVRGENVIRLEGEQRLIDGYAGGVVVTWGAARYDAVVGDFVVDEFTVRPMKRSIPFPARHSLHVVLVDAGQNPLGEAVVPTRGREPLRVELPRVVSVRALANVFIALQPDAA